MDTKNDRFCPLMEEIIRAEICFDIHSVVEDGAPRCTAPEKAVRTKDFEKICLHCRHHIHEE